ncbi:colicin immunity domain-containing protein [uncultured Shewanella sp.]|uniref:colicin immunity domain-containing protein n=1 Tax=uncultured Shewanella sp. TaxID=173975 RepID=UPI00262747CD|nr:colicin immunity domain-containing protein [uncultured Shewanella sp.]
MSRTLLALAESFVNERLSADDFANAYMELWKFECSSHILLEDEDRLSECLSSIFCLADSYYPSDREEYELDESQLKEKVAHQILISKVSN